MSLAQIAYETGLRALDKQERVLEELRARTGLLLAAASLAASLLGREAFVEASPAWLVVVALAAFVITLAASLYVLLPRRGFTFALGGPAVYEQLYVHRTDLDEVHRILAYDVQRFWDENDARLQPVFFAFRIGVGALAVEVLSLALLVSGNL